MRLIDLKGKKFGKLLVIERDFKPNYNRPHWKCVCECCNKEIIVQGVALTSGKKTSCEQRQQEKGVAGFRMLLRNYKGGAKVRGHSFELSEEDFKKLTQDVCYYCGSPPSSVAKKGNDSYIYNGIDRLDNNQGYALNNVVTACGICNNAKKAMTKNEFVSWIKKVHNNLQKKEGIQ